MNRLNSGVDGLNLPKPHITLIYIIVAVGLSQFVMYLDNARGAAYIIVPLLVAATWCRDANIRWSVNKKAKILTYCLGLMYGVGGFMMLALIISIEDGKPMIGSGLIYDIAKIMANT